MLSRDTAVHDYREEDGLLIKVTEKEGSLLLLLPLFSENHRSRAGIVDAARRVLRG